MMPRWLIAGGTVVAVAAAATVGVAVGSRDDDSNTAAATTPAADLNVAAVTRRDLARNEELDGTVGFGEESPLVLPIEGTLTSLPEPGTKIDDGSTIAAVDDQPVIAIRSDATLWRDLGPSVEDGEDVLAIERMLAQRGYAVEYDVTVDGDWTDATTSAVKAFQEDHGQDNDGEITRGEIVFIADALRVADVAGVVGQPASDAGITVTDPDPAINVDLEIADATLLATGDAVTVELPDGSSVPGTVASIGEASTDETGATTIPVEITVEEGVELPTGSPVDVLVSIVAADDVLAVPVEAVLALAEGGYAVEVREGAVTHLVAVELGTFADGFVEITGDVAEGAEVVIP
jgi:peptidoglycan hydrolase-like protein with peptidoglycan-binding domain